MIVKVVLGYSMNRGRIFAFHFMILIPLILILHLPSNNASGSNVGDWTTNIQEGTIISTTWYPWSEPGDTSNFEVMSGGVLTSFVRDNADVWEYEITEVTAETIWFTLESFDNAGNQRILSDPLPINRNNTDLSINLHYPLEEQVRTYFTPLITTNTSLLESTYENNTEYVLTIENDIIFFDYYNLIGTPVFAHHLEYDLDTGYFRYLEWIESIETSEYSVLESDVKGLYPIIRTNVIDQYGEGVCQMCILDLTGTTTTDTNTTTSTTTNTTTQPSIDASESDSDDFPFPTYLIPISIGLMIASIKRVRRYS